MGKNGFLERQKAVQRGFFEAGLQSGRQQILDMMSLVLRDPEVMGKDTFGKDRLVKVVNDDRRRLFENCRLKSKRTVNPIIDWKDDDVWDFIEDAKKPINPCYAEGWCRVGCVGCPMAGKEMREFQFARWPKYKNSYLLAFKNLLAERAARGKYVSWETPMDVFNWWMEYDILPGQIDLFEEMEDMDDV